MKRLRSLFRPRRALHQALQVDLLRGAVAWVRYQYLAGFKGQLRTAAPGESVSEATVEHNLRGLRDLAVRRSVPLIRVITALSCVDVASARVLSVGPRTEGELLSLVAHGFTPERVRGLDLISYSDWIDLGDMHAMPYADDSWDVVILPWVLAYSDEPQRAAREVVRVVRPGGVVAVGVEFNPLSNEQIVEQLGYLSGSRNRIESVEAVLGFFGDAVETVFFRDEPEPRQRDRIGAICTVFSVR